MTVHTNAEEVSQEIRTRIATISVANGFESDIGVSVFDGRIAVNDSDVPCASVVEGTDDVLSTPGRAALWKVEQHYTLVGYSPCDPAHPNAKARAIIRDLKRAIFKTNGKADATFGGKVLEIHYKGRNVGPRADGVGIVMGVISISVIYAESLA